MIFEDSGLQFNYVWKVFIEGFYEYSLMKFF